MARPRVAALAAAAIILAAAGATLVVAAGSAGKQSAPSASQTSLVTITPAVGQGHSSGDFLNLGRSYTCRAERAFQLSSVGVEHSLSSALRALLDSLLCRPVRSEGRAGNGR